METKICNKCKLAKPIDQFNFKVKTTGRRHSLCKSCVKGYTDLWYDTNRERHIHSNVKPRRDGLRSAGRKHVLEYLSSHPCVDCGEPDPVVLEFDHVRGTKTMLISYMVKRGYTIEALAEEISKCDVRCANCHKRRTARQQGSYKLRRLS